MTGRREPPDTKISPFPNNWRSDSSPGAHLATWGPDHSTPPLRAGEVVLIGRGNTIARFSLHVVLQRGLGFYIRGCKLVRWGPGERVFLPQRSATIKVIAPAADPDEEFTVLGTKNYYADLIFFDSNRGAAEFEQAALAAARFAVAQARREQPAPNGNGVDHDGVPF